MKTRLAFTLALLILISQYISAISGPGGVLCREKEKNALLDFKLSINFDLNGILSSWNTHNPECCDWEGVGCENGTGHVVFLHINNGGLKSHQLRPSLVQLEHLASLDLSYNSFSMRIPEFIGSLTKLTDLDLSRSGFYGKIPPHLGNLTSLQTLILSEESGLLYVDNLQWISNLSSLEMIGMDGVNLSNVTDWLFALTMLPSLQYFGCSFCSLPHVSPTSTSLLNHSTPLQTLDISYTLMDTLPDLSRLSSLSSLDASFTGINGNLSAILQHLPTSLTSLDLSSNSLSGIISDSDLSNFIDLQSLHLSDNYPLTFSFSTRWVPPFQLTDLSLRSCKVGPDFPKWVLKLIHLEDLDISNSSISDTIPISFWTSMTVLSSLNVSNNRLQGTLPNLSGRFESYYELDLSSNEFHGPIPVFIFSTSHTLDLSNNNFSSLPSSQIYVQNNSLEIINLSNNLISGNLPDWIFHSDELTILNLANNILFGTIPSNIASSFQLTSLHLNNNKFSGELPPSMKNCTRLLILDVGNNNFSGSVPFWLGDSLQHLIALSLRSNSFTGILPSNLCHLQKLQVLDLSGNKISGSIPNCVNDFTSMTIYEGFYSTDGDQLFSSMVINGFYMEDVDYVLIMWKGNLASVSYRNLPQRNLIDLSNNCLTGQIPSNLTSLKYLRSLDLSRNNLDGSIPDKIGQLKFLEVLKLSSNRLSGEIPQSLADMTFLNVLNLSINNLTGRIPRSTQLESLDPSCFGGNPKLCGQPLSTMCPGDELTIKPQPFVGDDINETFDFEAFYAAIGTGFGFGFLGIIGILSFYDPFRHSFFRMAAQVGDWIFVRTYLCQSRIKRRLCL